VGGWGGVGGLGAIDQQLSGLCFAGKSVFSGQRLSLIQCVDGAILVIAAVIDVDAGCCFNAFAYSGIIQR
jgi:hypothetical protein